MIKYSRVTIESISTDKFPEMVIIAKTPKKYQKDLEGKKFVSEYKCKAYIDEFFRYQSINTIARVAKTDLDHLGLGE